MQGLRLATVVLPERRYGSRRHKWQFHYSKAQSARGFAASEPKLVTLNAAHELTPVHDAVVAATNDTETVTASDGRSLTIAEWGDPDGFPVFSLHGAPGSRFARFYDERAYVEVGARVITYDRP